MQRLARRFYGDTADARVIPPNLNITAALQLACHALCSGGTVVFPISDEGAAVPRCDRGATPATHVTLPPSNLLAMLPLVQGPEPAFPAIRHLRLLGATPSPELIAQVRRRFSPNVCLTYSTSETGVIAFASPETSLARPGSAGRVTEGARRGDLRCAGPRAAAGTIGRDSCRGRGHAAGLPTGRTPAARSSATAGSIPGDHGRVDSEGFVYLEGRVDDILNVGGRKSHPVFVESILRTHPNVWDAAGVSFEDPIAGTRVGAAIEARGELDWASLDRHARLRSMSWRRHATSAWTSFLATTWAR
jgi:acyl-coenzyme A synthetase/AMP-(fatty) acid ligase